jgi:hypothetical protein
MKKFYLTFIFLLLFISLAFADTIYLKSGKIIQGTISEYTDKYIKINIGQGVELHYYFNEIDKVERGPASETKVFQLKPSPLLNTQPQPELKTEAPDKNKQTPEIDKQSNITQPTEKNPSEILPVQQKLTDKYLVNYGKSVLVNPKDLETIEKTISGYLNLVSQPLPKQTPASKELIDKFKQVVDVENMPAYNFLKKTLEQQKSNDFKFGQGQDADSLQINVLTSEIIRFQSTYKTITRLEINDFKIKQINFPETNIDCTAVVSFKDNILRFKLHNINSRWLIYSVY